MKLAGQATIDRNQIPAYAYYSDAFTTFVDILDMIEHDGCYDYNKSDKILDTSFHEISSNIAILHFAVPPECDSDLQYLIQSLQFFVEYSIRIHLVCTSFSRIMFALGSLLFKLQFYRSAALCHKLFCASYKITGCETKCLLRIRGTIITKFKGQCCECLEKKQKIYTCF